MNCNFDERQLKIRGNIYKHTLLIIVALLMLDAFLKDSGCVYATSFQSDFIIIMITAMIGGVEMIFFDVYYPNKKMKALFYIIGAILTIGIIRIFIEKRSLVLNGAITDNGFSVIISLCALIICIASIVKSVIYKKLEED